MTTIREEKPISISPPAASPGSRREWLPPLLGIIAFLLLGTIVFWLTDLDRQIISFFYQPEHPGQPWLISRAAFWGIVYNSPAYLTAFLAILSLTLIVLGQVRRHLRRFRIYGLFIFFSLALGPGLVVNVILKDNTGRPRPNQTVDFGGSAQYHPPLVLGERGVGRSFPSGHSSIGFIFALFWFLWRKQRPLLAGSALFAAVALGLLLSLQRLGSGSHFPSDILWSAGLSFLVPLLLYYFVFRIPQRQTGWQTSRQETKQVNQSDAAAKT